jgi:hypothetical protein
MVEYETAACLAESRVITRKERSLAQLHAVVRGAGREFENKLSPAGKLGNLFLC